MKHRLYLIPLAVLALAGCQGEPKTGGTSTGVDGKTANTSVNVPKEDQNAPKALRSSIPESFKHEAYQYFGFDNEGALDYKITKSADDTVNTGGASVTLVGITDKAALFSIDRTGSLQDLVGRQEYEVREDGVYATKYADATTDPAQFLQMPAQLPAGKTWPVKMTLTKNDGTVIVEDSIYKVVGTEKVKTEAGDYDALLITSTGTIEINGGGKNKATTKSYYAKGKGLVRAEVSLTQTVDGKPKTQSVTIQETK